MAQVKKFLFDISFDAPAAPQPKASQLAEQEVVAEAVPEEPPPPVFTEEEVNFAREEAFAQGREEGLREAEATRSWSETGAFKIIAEALSGLSRAQASANEANQKAAIEVALAVVRKLSPELAKKGALEEVAGVVRECLMILGNEQRVIVRVPEPLVEPIKGQLEDMVNSAGFEGKVVVMAAAGLGVADCKVEWADGGAERDVERLMRDIGEVAERYLAQSSGEAQASEEALGEPVDMEVGTPP
jgi:flagellar assembly protein FliH